jgi:hypothetical protein
MSSFSLLASKIHSERTMSVSLSMPPKLLFPQYMFVPLLSALNEKYIVALRCKHSAF